jgi:hypothetical protein
LKKPGYGPFFHFETFFIKLSGRNALYTFQLWLPMKKLLFTATFFLFAFMCFGQEDTADKLDRLLQERSGLIKEYNYLNAQNSNFWGKKSKKDLLQIIGNLKDIIKKDSEIINSIQSYTVKRNAELQVKEEKITTEVQQSQQFVNDRLHDLNQQLKSSQNLAKVKQRRITDLEDQLKDQKSSAYERDRVILVLGGLCLLLIIYIVLLRIRKKAPAKRKPKRV